MKRISAEEVLEAYRKTGLQPLISDWLYEEDDGKLCGCALTALSVKRRGLEETLKIFKSYDGERDMVSILPLSEYSEKYLSSFVLGFDGNVFTTEDDEEIAGMDDGWVARQLVNQHYTIIDGGML